ncbi:MAG: Mov34/MPN/PAD-1 family protein [Candidatus Margulisiibacteriota bacterium]
MDAFSITKRHYDLIIQQALANLPQESGGFVGGKEGVIQGVMPVFNQHLYNKTDTFGVTADDVLRAHEFFAKHGLDCYGVYHSHPKGIPEPSEQDIKTRQKYHFIVGLRNPKKPILNAFIVEGTKPRQLPLRIINDNYFKPISGPIAKESKPNLAGDLQHEAQALGELLNDMKYQRLKYPRLDPKEFEDSDFSTLA